MKIAKFGIEIRKIADVDSLFKDVNSILKKYDVPINGVTGNIQAATIAHSIQKMISTDRHFSVCTIKECAEISKIKIAKDRMDIYSAIHCMNWNEMLPDYREVIVSMVLDDFRTVLYP